jgi:hypothetical protein
MTPRSQRRRRVALAVAIAAAGMLPLRLAAQDAHTTAVQNAARDWLALLDRKDVKGSWDAAGAKFRSVMPLEKWTSAIEVVRAPLGSVAARTIASTRFGNPGGASDGEYAVVVFRTAFATRPAASETVTLQREGDVWRVIGYVIG